MTVRVVAEPSEAVMPEDRTAACEFGIGLACLNGAACRNPHHDPRPWVVRGFALRPLVEGQRCRRRNCGGDGDARWEITAPAGFSMRRRHWVCDSCVREFLSEVLPFERRAHDLIDPTPPVRPATRWTQAANSHPSQRSNGKAEQ